MKGLGTAVTAATSLSFDMEEAVAELLSVTVGGSFPHNAPSIWCNMEKKQANWQL